MINVASLKKAPQQVRNRLSLIRLRTAFIKQSMMDRVEIAGQITFDHPSTSCTSCRQSVAYCNVEQHDARCAQV